MRRLRVLFIASGFYKVGDYFRFKALAETLAQLGHSVSVLTGDPRFRVFLERENINGVEWLYPPYFGGLAAIEKLTDYLPETKLPYDILYRIYFMFRHASNYDVVHGFHVGFNTFLPLVAARRPRRLPVLFFDWCDLWDNGIIRPPTSGFFKKLDYRRSVALEPLSTRYVDGVTVNNKYLGKKAEGFRADRTDVRRIEIVRDGAYSEEIKPLDKQLARQQLHIEPEIFLLGFSGFFQPDTALLFEAFAKVRARSEDPVKLLFIGSRSQRLIELSARYGVREAVIFAGPVEHEKIGEYLSACDVLLLPYTNRPVNLGRWPFKLGDYLSAGRPVVAGGYGDVLDFFLQHPHIGITCEGTADSFAEAILDLKNDPARIERGARAARQAAVADLSWTRNTCVLEQFYGKLIDEKAR